MNCNTSTFFNVSKPIKDQGQICILKIPKPKSAEDPDRNLIENMCSSAEAIRQIRKRSRLSVKTRDRSRQLFSISKLVGCQTRILGLLKTELESNQGPQPSLLQQLPEKYLQLLCQELLPLLQQPHQMEATI